MEMNSAHNSNTEDIKSNKKTQQELYDKNPTTPDPKPIEQGILVIVGIFVLFFILIGISYYFFITVGIGIDEEKLEKQFKEIKKNEEYSDLYEERDGINFDGTVDKRKLEINENLDIEENTNMYKDIEVKPLDSIVKTPSDYRNSPNYANEDESWRENEEQYTTIYLVKDGKEIPVFNSFVTFDSENYNILEYNGNLYTHTLVVPRNGQNNFSASYISILKFDGNTGELSEIANSKEIYSMNSINPTKITHGLPRSDFARSSVSNFSIMDDKLLVGFGSTRSPGALLAIDLDDNNLQLIAKQVEQPKVHEINNKYYMITGAGLDYETFSPLDPTTLKLGADISSGYEKYPEFQDFYAYYTDEYLGDFLVFFTYDYGTENVRSLIKKDDKNNGWTITEFPRDIEVYSPIFNDKSGEIYFIDEETLYVNELPKYNLKKVGIIRNSSNKSAIKIRHIFDNSDLCIEYYDNVKGRGHNEIYYVSHIDGNIISKNNILCDDELNVIDRVHPEITKARRTDKELRYLNSLNLPSSIIYRVEDKVVNNLYRDFQGELNSN